MKKLKNGWVEGSVKEFLNLSGSSLVAALPCHPIPLRALNSGVLDCHVEPPAYGLEDSVQQRVGVGRGKPGI